MESANATLKARFITTRVRLTSTVKTRFSACLTRQFEFPGRFPGLEVRSRLWRQSQTAARRHPYSLLAALRAARRSTTNFSYSRCRDCSSGCRSRDDGCTVAMALGASFDDNSLPRSRVTRNDGPKTACAAVAPRHTSNFGLTRRSSASSHGRHAAISREFGF